MSKRDYYEVLGLSKTATADEIKKAYRKLAKEFHPDKNAGDKEAEEKFKEISEAYEHLSDENKKAKYDRFGHSGGNDTGFNPFRTRNPFSGFNPFGNDFTQTQRVGANMSLLLKLSLEEIFNGVKKTYKYTRNVSCHTCEGHGGTDVHECSTCNGSGSVTQVYNTPIGYVQQQSTCTICDGVGKTYKTKCNTCNGSGLEKKEETIEVEVPAGVQEGMTFVMSGKGHGVKSGIEGDLHIKVMELPHSVFTRNGADLKMNLKLSYPQLVLGDKVEIETIENSKIRISVPEGSDVGSNLRIPNKGTKIYGKEGRGDLIINLGVDIPKKPSDKLKSAIIDLKEIIDEQ
jgi:molecular chaperone DnaJ